MSNLNNYPQAVKDYVTTVIESLDESNFFIEKGMPTHGRKAAEQVFTELAYESWLKNGTCLIDEETKALALKDVLIVAFIASLEEKGFVDIYEDKVFIKKDAQSYFDVI